MEDNVVGRDIDTFSVSHIEIHVVELVYEALSINY